MVVMTELYCFTIATNAEAKILAFIVGFVAFSKLSNRSLCFVYESTIINVTAFEVD